MIRSFFDNSKRIVSTNTTTATAVQTMSTSSMISSTNMPQAALFEGDKLWQAHWKEGPGEATLKRRMLMTKQINNNNADDADRTPEPQLVLYSSWFCPFAQRAWIVAEECDLDYQWVEINPYEVNPNQPGGYTKKALTLAEKAALYPDFIQASPRGLVPAILHHNDKDNGNKGDDKAVVVLWESLPVCEYIDACFGNGKLSLRNRNNPYDVARLQIWSTHCTERIQKKFYQALTAAADDGSTIQKSSFIQDFYQECRVLAQAMRTDDVNNGYYFNATEFSLVDVALAPFWQRFLTVGKHYLGLVFPMNEPEFQRLNQWWQAVSARPSVAATLVCEARLVASYQDYARNVATSDVARNFIK
jgi:glutathione S-transferase